jgi:hypothetical protein
MKKTALGILAAATLFTATAVPAMAQVGFYVGPGGIGVGVGPPVYDEYYGPRYYDYAGPRVVVTPGYRHYYHRWDRDRWDRD